MTCTHQVLLTKVQLYKYNAVFVSLLQNMPDYIFMHQVCVPVAGGLRR